MARAVRRLGELWPSFDLPRASWNDGRRLHVVTFYTEGPPSDRGLDLRDSLATLRGLVAPHVDGFTAFCPRTLRAMPGAERVCKEYPGAPLPMNQNAEFLGYFDFKPFILLHVLSQAEDGDLVLYHDCNLVKYRTYASQGFATWRDLCQTLLQQLGTDVFVPVEHPSLKVHMHVKLHTLRRLLPSPELVRQCADRPLINASRVLVRKSPLAEEFLREWLDLATQPELVGPEPNPEPHPGFKWNCGDQDVLNVLVFAWLAVRQKLPAGFPGYYLRDRRLQWTCVKRLPGG